MRRSGRHNRFEFVEICRRARNRVAVNQLRLAFYFDRFCFDVFESQIIFARRFQMLDGFRVGFVKILEQRVLPINFER